MVKFVRLVFLFFCPFFLQAQEVDLEQVVTLKYRNQQLGFILSDISRKYGVPFSYSSNFIPVGKKLTISEYDIPLEEGLNVLFAPTQIVYAVIGNFVGLKIDESKEVKVTVDKIPPLQWKHPMPPGALEKIKNLTSTKNSQIPEPVEAEQRLEKEMVQVTLIPPISTNEELAEKTTNTFSFNIFWGRNGGLDGLEMGGFVNSIAQNMRGFQLAGVGNKVDGNAQGAQVATFFNYNEGYTNGVQLSGLFNIANRAKVIQIAGMANLIQDDFEGLQAALFGNVAKTKANGTQIAGLLNFTKGQALTQISGGFNIAGEVKNTQIGLFNFAEYARGRQIGLFNFSYNANQTPIGLFNFIQNGYNKLELSAGEALFASAGLKLGVRKFYNILQLGTQFTNDIWSIGYGIGTAFQLKERQFFHIELVTSHINENEIWTKKLNLLNQLKFQFDWKTKNKYSFFLGPTWNLQASKITDPETLEITGSRLPRYTILNTTRKNTNWKMWFGLCAGFRI